ncbi:MAG TPA: recombinase family protein [Acidobacteriota bacterium]|nr:recombinase family protein [Acidobacteriota bacterium]
MTCSNSSTATLPVIEPAARRRQAALYLRAAGDAEKEETLVNLRRYARLRGFVIEGEYIDRRAAKERPALERLFKHAGEGRFEGVLVESLEHLGPQLRQAVLTLERLECTGTALVSLDEGLDTTRGDEKTLRNLIRGLAALARDRYLKLRLRISRGMHRAREMGANVGRPAKEVDEEEIFRLAEKGLSYRAIARTQGISHTVVGEILERGKEK